MLISKKEEGGEGGGYSLNLFNNPVRRVSGCGDDPQASGPGGGGG